MYNRELPPFHRPASGSLDWQRWAVLGLLALGLAFRLSDLGARDLWTDEAWVALAALQPTAREALAAGQSTPPFYLLAVWGLAQLWGGQEAALRFVSFVFGVALMPLCWLLARRLTSPAAALTALALVALSPVLVYFSKELKQYSSDACLAALVWWLTERLRDTRGQQGRLPLALAGVVGLGFSHPLVFVLPVAWAALWRALPSRARLPLIGVGVLWAAALTGYYWLFFRHQAIPDLVAYWVQDFPDFSGLGAFLSWLVQAWRRYVLYFFGERSLWWGLPVLAAGVAALIQRGPARLLWYWAGPLGLALVAAALHRYPFMGHSGGSRLMLFSAPALYIVAAVGLSAAAQGLWRRRQVWALALLLGVFLWAVQPLRLVKENLHPTPNRADIEPLVAYLTEQRRPADWVYVYYFATAPFQYYYRGDGEKVIWGKSCAERGLCLPPSQYQGVRRLWLISAHYPDLNYMKQFAAHLLGPGWVQTLLLEQEGAALFFFERQPAAGP